MEVYTSKHEKIILADNAFSSGGEGEVRHILFGPSRFKNVCAKIYYQKKRTQQQENKIKYMVATPPAKVIGDGFMIGWPLDYVTDAGGNFLGFIMPLAFPESKQLITLTAPKLNKKLGTPWHNRYDRTNGKSALISRLKLICNIAIPIHILHSTGKYVLKDFKPENILITHDGHVTIVDMDSVQICEGSQLLFPGTAATPNYMPPEYYTKGVGKAATVPLNKSWDNFAIGIVFYQILFGLHPYVVTPRVQQDADSNEIFQSISSNLFPFGPNQYKIEGYPDLHNKFKILPKTVQSLFLRTFSDNASQRPNAEEWGKCIYGLVVNANNIPTPQPASIQTPQPASKPTPVPKPTPIPTPKPPVTPIPQPTPWPWPVPTHPTESELDSWNWGAFFFNWIWGLFNGVYWPLLLIAIGWIPYVGQIGALIGAIYLGTKGTRQAWNAKNWDSWNSFKETQHKWAVAIWWVLGVFFILGLIIGSMSS